MMTRKKPIKIDYSPSDFLGGTILLDPWEELAYRRIIDLIYVNGGSVPDNKALDDLTKTGRRWGQIRKKLIKIDKIYTKNGHIYNERCTREIAKKLSQMNNGRAGAEKTNSLKDNNSGPQTPDSSPTSSPTGKSPAERAAKGPAKGSQPLTLNPEPLKQASKAAGPDRKMVAAEALRLAGIDPEQQKDFGSADYHLITSWLNAGAVPERHIYPTISTIMERNGADPRSLRYFNQAVIDAIENVPAQLATNGQAEGREAALTPPKHLTKDEAQNWRRLRSYFSKGSWFTEIFGPPPDDPDCRIDPAIIADAKASAEAEVAAKDRIAAL